MNTRTARFRQHIQEIQTPEGVYYGGWFATGGIRHYYSLEFFPTETLLSIWNGGEQVELEEDERQFLIWKLSEFNRWRQYARPFHSDKDGFPSNEESLLWTCSILRSMILLRRIDLTPEAMKILTRPKFGCEFFEVSLKRRLQRSFIPS